MKYLIKLLKFIQDDDGTSGNTGIELPSVRERMQRFNQMACETDLPGRPNGTTTPTKKRNEKVRLKINYLFIFKNTIFLLLIL